MNDNHLKWILQSSEFGIANCNSSHDINNILAILMGYTENLEYMLESGDLSKSELQDICEKLFYVIDKLNSQSRQIASERKRICIEARSRDFTDYFHSWLKLNSPMFKEKNIIINFVNGPEFITEQIWSRVNLGLAFLFEQIFGDFKTEQAKKLEFFTEVSDQGVKILFTKPSGLQVTKIGPFLNNEVSIKYDTDYFELLLTCFSKKALSESAA